MSSKNERGATMVETALVFVVFILLIGAVFDVGMALYQYSILRHVTNKTARDITVDLASANYARGCSEFRDILSKYLADDTGQATRLVATGGTNAAQVRWDCAIRAGAGPLRSFQLRGEMPANCAFICRFFPQDWRIGTTAATTIDSMNVPTCDPSPVC